ncbi:hypothetical protein H1C71_001665, partial [Ictidomys tridecemlineatus]
RSSLPIILHGCWAAGSGNQTGPSLTQLKILITAVGREGKEEERRGGERDEVSLGVTSVLLCAHLLSEAEELRGRVLALETEDVCLDSIRPLTRTSPSYPGFLTHQPRPLCTEADSWMCWARGQHWPLCGSTPLLFPCCPGSLLPLPL